MGLGDYLHWTAIIRDLHKYINIGNNDDKVSKINQLKMKNGDKYGIQDFKNDDNNKDFKFFVYITNAGCPLFKHKEGKQIFDNNPYVIKSPAKYPNVIMLLIVSSDYFIVNKKKFLDDKHVVERYAQHLRLTDFNNYGDIHFTQEEIDNVNKYLPKKDFIFIEPVNHKPGRSYPFEKFQEMVEAFKDKIDFVQVSPQQYGVKDNKKLNNVTNFTGEFSFRETILFMSYAKLCIVNHGGLSIGSAVTKTKTICFYPALFNPKMVTYDSEEVIYVADDNHNSCGQFDGNYKEVIKRFPNGCPKCWELYCKFDNSIAINKIKEIID